MDFELLPTVSLRSRTFNAMIAPRELFIQALNRHLDLQHFSVLYICGNYSGILTKLHRRFTELEVCRAFTSFQLMTILEKAHHSLIFVEHDPLLYENAEEMTEYVSQAMRESAKETAVLLYSPGNDPFMEDLTRNADRIFYFEEESKDKLKMVAKAHPRTQKSQTTLEAFL